MLQTSGWWWGGRHTLYSPSAHITLCFRFTKYFPRYYILMCCYSYNSSLNVLTHDFIFCYPIKKLYLLYLVLVFNILKFKFCKIHFPSSVQCNVKMNVSFTIRIVSDVFNYINFLILNKIITYLNTYLIYITVLLKTKLYT